MLRSSQVFFDFYWWWKVRTVYKSAQVTEKLIDNMNKGGIGMKDLLGKKKKDAKFVDESILDLVEADKKAVADEEQRLKEEEEAEEKRKKKEAKKKKKTMTRSERKKRRAERVIIGTNLPENRRIVREAIKTGKLDRVKEDQIDPLEITDRLDMMSHRSDILMRSAERLLDQVMVLSEEANQINLDGDDDDESSVVPKKKVRSCEERAGREKRACSDMLLKRCCSSQPLAPPYGKTGEMFGLRGVREPMLDTPEKRITDLEQNERDTFAMRVPKLDEQVKNMEDPQGLVQPDDISNMYQQLGYDNDVANKAKEFELTRQEKSQEKAKEDEANDVLSKMDNMRKDT